MAPPRQGEDALVAQLARLFAAPSPRLAGAIGDDAAVLRTRAGERLVWTTDTLVEGRDFLRDTPPSLLGGKAMAASVSDVAAMGAEPIAALLTMTLPADTPRSWSLAVGRGAAAAARRWGAPVAGGDLSGGSERALAVTMLGTLGRRAPLRRSGGSAGDDLWVSGTLGAAALGLALQACGWQLRRSGTGWRAVGPRRRAAERELAAQAALMLLALNSPAPPVGLAVRLARLGLATAAMDLSDGIARDVPRLARASACGAEVSLESLPAVALSPTMARAAGLGAGDARFLALCGGEDYALLFAAPPSRRTRLQRLGCTRIGALTSGSRLLLRTAGRTRAWPQCGFDHLDRS